MPEFRDREEYEKWKAQRLRDLKEKQDQSVAGGAEGNSGEETGEREKPEGFQPSPDGGGNEGYLADPGELFKKAWDIYKRRAGVLIALYILSFLFLVGAFGLCLGSGYLFSIVFHTGGKVLLAAGAITGVIAGSIFFTWGLAAVTYAVADEGLGIREALGRGGAAIWPFMWLISLIGYIIPGGFLLFIIPGVMFSVWFAFSQFIFVTEGRKGMDCLLKSKEYVRGQWFEVFLRLFLIWIASVVIGSVPLLGPILSFLFMPYLLIFIWLVYNDVKSLKGEVAYSTATSEKLKWIGAATLGYIALPLFVIFLMGASIMTFPFLLLKGCLVFKGH
jgi:hypothetical protein